MALGQLLTYLYALFSLRSSGTIEGIESRRANQFASAN